MTRLRKVLKMRGVTGKEFAAMCGVSRSCIYKYLSGNRVLSLKIARKFAEYLDVEPSELMGFDDEGAK